MRIRKLIYTLIISSIFSSTKDPVTVPINLQDYITSLSNNDLVEVVACAASAEGSTSMSYIFYYPEAGATEIRYYAADCLNVDNWVDLILIQHSQQSNEIYFYFLFFDIFISCFFTREHNY